VAETYDAFLRDIPGVILPPRPGPGARMSWFVYVIRLADEFQRPERDAVLEELRRQGVACSNYFSPIHLQEYYRERFHYRPGDFPVTEYVSDRTIALPFFNQLTEAQVARVAQALANALNAVRPCPKIARRAAAVYSVNPEEA
jgi:perosamine synthetase